MFALSLILAGVISIVYIFHSKCNTSQQKLQALKKCIARMYFWNLKRKQKRIFQYHSSKKDIHARGIAASDEEWLYEKSRPLKNDVQAEDTVEFFGVDNNGNALVVHLARRHDRIAETWIYLKTKSGEEYQSLIHPDCAIFNTDGKSFSAGGLTLEVLEPLRAWRVIFRGILRKGIQNEWNNGKYEEVKVCFNFLWRNGYHHFVVSQDFDTKAISETLSKLQWDCKDFKNFKINSDERYEQWGRMNGTIEIGKEEKEVKLWGTKIRSHGIRDICRQNKRFRLHLHTKIGSVVSMQVDDNPDGIRNITHGYFVQASNFCHETISNTNINLDYVFRKNKQTGEMEIDFTSNCKPHNIKLKLENQGFQVFQGSNWDTCVNIRLVKGFLDDDAFSGVVEFTQPFVGNCPLAERKSLPILKEIDTSNFGRLTVNLSDPESRSSNLVGGKGASLALMMTIKNSQEKFEVPNGICLTRHAFLEHLKKNSEIQNSITQLENITWKRIEGSIKTQCEIVSKMIENSMIANGLKSEIKQQLQLIFGDNFDKIPFAIRSSAIGEDGEEMSAAGQNETYLGTIGITEICCSITKCWASQFSFRAIEYKRKNGQLLNAGMGVVIQQMVPSEISGVMFNGDPVTGAFGYVTINANYGLGESVVSAIADPDSIILHRNWDDKLSIIDKQIGKKKIKITLKDNGGTEEEEIADHDAIACTLSDELAIQLGKVAIFLDKCYGGPRDIEWAVNNGIIHLLQCRPITTYLQETRYEILHEYDSPIVSDNGRFTRANVGEVVPGAISPLTLSALTRSWALLADVITGTTYSQAKYNPLVSLPFGMINYCNSWLGDRVFQKLFSLSKKPDATINAMKLALFGRIIEDDDVHEIALNRYPFPTAFGKLKSFYTMFLKNIFGATQMVKQSTRLYENYEIPLNGLQNAEQLYNRMSQAFYTSADAVYKHVMCSCPTMVWNHIILNILADGKDYTLDHYHDFANLVGKGNGAISGDVPFSLKKMSKIIPKEKDRIEFSTMPSEEALDWLTTSNTQSSIHFKEFLKKHSHRGYMEFELSIKTWGLEPIKLVKVLQAMLSTTNQEDNEESEETIKEIISKLKTPLSSTKKWILSWALSFVRTAVMNRESAKSLAIRVIHAIRLAYMKLGEMLVKEGRIPDTDILYFLTHDEIGHLLKVRSARLLARAYHRQRLYPFMNSLHYDEFVSGEPKAIEETKEDPELQKMLKNSTKITGYPVSQGVIKGPARVILNFDEVDQIKPGDILITYSTDIGWSPYFPMLGGVVTEIGGLVSHGAVVAREYGLPAIVAAIGATKIFKSGDIVYLNASKGTLEKISE